MKSNAYRAALLSLVLVLSSLSGCLSADEEQEENEVLGKVMVSTYHVGELVSAVAGDTLDVEIISPSNVPVHDYEPSAGDLIRLQESDLFFYHGLNLEPWVESALDTLGSDAPVSAMTHTMPSGETTLDYESILISDLCDLLTEGPFESTTLAMGEDHDDHDDHSDEEDDHDDHSDEEDDHDDDHDDHDDHEGHEHAEAEETIQNPTGCPADTIISIFHMEEGEYVLEFESEHDEDFNMATLKMPGGHAHHHHDHGHDDHDDEEGDHDGHDDEMCHNTETHENYESTEEECEASGHEWMGDDDHDDHGDHEGDMCHNTDTHENYESTEEECEAAGHMWIEDEHHDFPEIHAEYVAHTLSFPEDDDHDDHSDEEDDHDDHSGDEEGHHEVGYVVIHIEEEGDYGFALPMDIEFFVLVDEDGHDDHDDHSDEEDDHDNHSDEEDDHSDEEDDHDDHSDEEIEFDPHSWLDPLAFKAQVDVVKDVLIANFPDHEATFVENADAYKTELDFLHIGYQSAFGEGANCAGNTVVANHNAYSYIAQRYDIQFVTVHGLDPEGEPTAENVAEVVEQIEEGGLTVLFVEEYTDQTAVAGLVEQTTSDTMPNGIDIETLYTMELPPINSEDNYLTLMGKNLNNLKSGMNC